MYYEQPNGFALLAAGGEPSSETGTASRSEKAKKRGAHQPSGAPPHDRSIMFLGGTGASSENALLGYHFEYARHQSM
jgi:hypothetical protein